MKTIGTCDACKWWKEDEKFSHMGTFCDHPKICEDSTKESQADDALVYSFNEGGFFNPGPKFGCVHWEEKS
jgi:hypothetical protein